MSGAPTFAGIDVPLAGVVYVMPRLSFGGFDAARLSMEKIAKGEVESEVELRDAFIDTLHAAFKRNYPDMPRQLLVNELDWETAPALFHQLMAFSVPSAGAGEKAVARPSGSSTGKARQRKS